MIGRPGVRRDELPAAIGAVLALVEPERRQRMLDEFELFAADQRQDPEERAGALLCVLGLRALLAGGDPAVVLAEFF
jgi:hypothetical protein